jgi:hypothetical protein
MAVEDLMRELFLTAKVTTFANDNNIGKKIF